IMKIISILGVSGSIGTQAIDVLRNHKDKFQLGAISVGRNINYLEEILEEFNPPFVSVMEESDYLNLKQKYPEVEFTYGDEGLIDVATYKTDLLLTAVMGSVGLIPTIKAIESGTDIALANKETLVAAGS